MARTGISMTKGTPGYRGFSGTSGKMAEACGGMTNTARRLMKRKARKAARQTARKVTSTLAYHDDLAREARERADEQHEQDMMAAYDWYLTTGQ